MILRSVMFLAAGLLLAGGAPNSDPAKQEMEKFQGTWKLAALEINGEQVVMDKFPEASLVIRGEHYHFTMEKTKLEMTFKIDPTKKPKTIDMTVTEGPQKGKMLHAIYVLEGDTYKVCRHVEPDKQRPTEFATKPNSGLMVVTWKRQKP